MKNSYYVYIYLDPRKPGRWEYKNWVFLFQPLYVGYGRGNRILQHLCPSNLADKSYKSNKLNKILKLGLEPIYFKIEENLEKIQAEEIEINIISHFGRKSEGNGFLTNITAGGKGGTFKKGNPIRNSKLGRYTSRSKKINQFDLNKVLINTFDSLTDAGNSLLINSSKKNKASKIDLCCKKQRNTAFGFIWEFEGSRPFEQGVRKNSQVREVYQYSIDGLFIKKFNSMVDAVRSLGKIQGTSNLALCCKGKLLICLGFRWFYTDQGLKIPPMPKKYFILFPDNTIHCFSSPTKMEDKYNLSYRDIYKFFQGKPVKNILTLEWKIPNAQDLETLPKYYEEF